MKKSTTYLLLAVVFSLTYLIASYTHLYESPVWFKAFILILAITFWISGIFQKQKE